MKTTLMATAILIMMISQAEAQEGGRGGFNPEQMIERMFENDKNSDGKLSSDEVTGRMSTFFERLDANEDGFVTREEVQTMMAGGRGGPGGGQGGRGGGPGGGQGGRGGGPGGPGGGFGGGQGGRGGGPGGPGGGFGGGQGGRGGGPGGRGGEGGMSRMLTMIPVIIVLDQDMNGEISAAEIKAASESLKKLDVNKDGKITLEEMAPDFSRMGRGGEGGRGGPGGRGGGFGGGPAGPGVGQGGGPGGRGENGRPKRPDFGGDGGPDKS